MKPDSENLPTQLNNEIIIVGSILSKKIDEQYKLDLLDDPNNALLHASYGYFLYEMGRLEEADKEFKIALEIDPQRAAIHSNYGRLLYRLGQFEEAEKHYRLALQIDPKNAVSHENYGFFLLK